VDITIILLARPGLRKAQRVPIPVSHEVRRHGRRGQHSLSDRPHLLEPGGGHDAICKVKLDYLNLINTRHVTIDYADRHCTPNVGGSAPSSAATSNNALDNERAPSDARSAPKKCDKTQRRSLRISLDKQSRIVGSQYMSQGNIRNTTTSFWQPCDHQLKLRQK
jgi:hypothetical protein